VFIAAARSFDTGIIGRARRSALKLADGRIRTHKYPNSEREDAEPSNALSVQSSSNQNEPMLVIVRMLANKPLTGKESIALSGLPRSSPATSRYDRKNALQCKKGIFYQHNFALVGSGAAQLFRDL
jgi:hypothetical protein